MKKLTVIPFMFILGLFLLCSCGSSSSDSAQAYSTLSTEEEQALSQMSGASVDTGSL